MTVFGGAVAGRLYIYICVYVCSALEVCNRASVAYPVAAVRPGGWAAVPRGPTPKLDGADEGRPKAPDVPRAFCPWAAGPG